jgi:hypothetical protein
MKLVDISGIGHSGKTAVSDLLKEVNDITVHPSSFEFNLLRLTHGVIDLKYSICENWSPIRSDYAIKNFLSLVEKLDKDYSNVLNINFKSCSIGFIETLIVGKLHTNWYDDYYKTNRHRFFTIPIFFKKIAKTIFNIIGYKYGDTKIKQLVYLVDNEKADEKITKYLENLLFSNIGFSDYIVTHNAFEPFNPSSSLNLFNEAYSIIVVRDPRDIYLSTINNQSIFIPEFESNSKVYSTKYLSELKKDFLGSQDINLFIQRQKLYWKNLSQENSKFVKIIYFEELVLNYEATVNDIFSFLKINKLNHLNKKKYFDPEKSKKNIRLWENSNLRNELEILEKELGIYFYE